MNGDKPRILIIDDEESIRQTLKDILEYEDYKVELAKDGEEGLKMLEKGVTVAPEDFTSNHNLGYEYAKRGNFLLAEFHLRRAIELQDDVAEILVWRRVRKNLNHFNSGWGKPLGHDSGNPGAKTCRFFVDNCHCFGRAASSLVNCQKTFNTGFGYGTETRTKPESVFQATRNDFV